MIKFHCLQGSITQNPTMKDGTFQLIKRKVSLPGVFFCKHLIYVSDTQGKIERYIISSLKYLGGSKNAAIYTFYIQTSSGSPLDTGGGCKSTTKRSHTIFWNFRPWGAVSNRSLSIQPIAPWVMMTSEQPMMLGDGSGDPARVNRCMPMCVLGPVQMSWIILRCTRHKMFSFIHF